MGYSKFNLFLDELETRCGQLIISAISFGSPHGILHPKLSDIDILLICRDRESIAYVMKVVRHLETKYFHISHSGLTNSLEKNIFASNDFTGLHVLAIGQDELTKDFQPRSFRLKLLTKTIISTNFFLYSLKKEHHVLFGKDLIKSIPHLKPTFYDRILCFIGPFIFMLTLPFIINRSSSFKIWCFKIIKFIHEYQSSYRTLAGTNSSKDPLPTLVTTASKYRYFPSSYHKSKLGLYFITWAYLLKRTSFVWTG